MWVWVEEWVPVAASEVVTPMPLFMGPGGTEVCSHLPAGWGSGLAVHLLGGDWQTGVGGSQGKGTRNIQNHSLRGLGGRSRDIPKGKGKAQGDTTHVFKISAMWF